MMKSMKKMNKFFFSWKSNSNFFFLKMIFFYLKNYYPAFIWPENCFELNNSFVLVCYVVVMCLCVCWCLFVINKYYDEEVWNEMKWNELKWNEKTRKWSSEIIRKLCLLWNVWLIMKCIFHMINHTNDNNITTYSSV